MNDDITAPGGPQLPPNPRMPQPGPESTPTPPVTGTAIEVNVPSTESTQTAESSIVDPEDASDIGEAVLDGVMSSSAEPGRPQVGGELQVPASEPEDLVPGEVPKHSLSEVKQPEVDGSQEDRTEAMKEPEVLAAGQEAYTRVIDSVEALSLSADEAQALHLLAERARMGAEQEVMQERLQYPEVKLMRGLSELQAKLTEAGLDDDATIIGEQIARITQEIAVSAEILKQEGEYLWFSTKAGSTDRNRMYYLAQQQGLLKGIRSVNDGVVLSLQHSSGLKEDTNGITYNEEEATQFKDRLEQAGQMPEMSEAALTLVLQRVGILQEGQTIQDLEAQKERPDLKGFFSYGVIGRGGSMHADSELAGQDIVYSCRAAYDGKGVTRSLAIRLKPEFVIAAAKRKHESQLTAVR